jgi:hypothetical protein
LVGLPRCHKERCRCEAEASTARNAHGEDHWELGKGHARRRSNASRCGLDEQSHQHKHGVNSRYQFSAERQIYTDFKDFLGPEEYRTGLIREGLRRELGAPREVGQERAEAPVVAPETGAADRNVPRLATRTEIWKAETFAP